MPRDRQGTEALQGEEAIIALLAPLTQGYPGAFGLKDDCALLAPPAGMELVLKTDPIAAGVHFLPDAEPADVAWKALAVNVSDIVAKGATPLGYLLALSFPEAPTLAWMSAFVSGLRAAQTAFGCHLMGGDTDRRRGPLTVSVTLIGSVPQGKMVPRTTARPGDRLLVSGTIGDAALGLALVRDDPAARAWPLSPADAAWLRRRYHRPEPRLALAPVLRRYATAAMDVSDGLVKDSRRLVAASGLSGHLRAGSVPLSAPARSVVAGTSEWLGRLITGGDDYEVLAAVPESDVPALLSAAAAAGVTMTEIGEVVPGSGALTVDGPDGRPLTLPERTGWDHF